MLPWCCAWMRKPRSRPWIVPPAILPLLPGVPQRSTHDYNRHGTKDFYAALDTASGKVIMKMTNRNRTKDFIEFMEFIDGETPKNLHLHIILDNVSTHNNEEAPTMACGQQRALHFPLPHRPCSSQVNLVERWFSELTTKWTATRYSPIHRRTHRINTILDRQLERKPSTLHMVQNSRINPRKNQQISHTN